MRANVQLTDNLHVRFFENGKKINMNHLEIDICG